MTKQELILYLTGCVSFSVVVFVTRGFVIWFGRPVLRWFFKPLLVETEIVEVQTVHVLHEVHSFNVQRQITEPLKTPTDFVKFDE